ncbi:MAG: M20 family metallopeptidase [Gaiellaceae bacterium]
MLAWLRARQDEIVTLLDNLVLAESPSTDFAALERPFAILAKELDQLDYVVRRVRGRNTGDHLYSRPRERHRHKRFQLVLGHMDTVWPLGMLRQMPLRRDGDNVFGPGTYDMKGGLVELVFALRVLQAFDLSPALTPVVLFNADEETGSLSSHGLIEALARRAERVYVLEGGEGNGGRLKIARKGIGDFTVTVHGRASHAGSSFDRGVSAILELSHQVQRLFALNDRERGITVNVGMIDGGLRPNVVAAEASAVVSVRVPSMAAGAEVEKAIRALVPVLEGTVVEVEGAITTPPMEPTSRNRRLLSTARQLGYELGLTVEDAGLAGGGSDANTTSLYAATLDGLGPTGDSDHAIDEHVSISSIVERSALLALLLVEDGSEPALPCRPVRSPDNRRVG